MNYAPLILVFIGLIAIWWQLSAKNWFSGPIRQVGELPDETGRVPDPGTSPAGG